MCTTKQRRGFALLTPEKRSVIASRGGKAAHRNMTGHVWSCDEVRIHGRQGGLATQRLKRLRAAQAVAVLVALIAVGCDSPTEPTSDGLIDTAPIAREWPEDVPLPPPDASGEVPVDSRGDCVVLIEDIYSPLAGEAYAVVDCRPEVERMRVIPENPIEKLPARDGSVVIRRHGPCPPERICVIEPVDRIRFDETGTP